SKEASPANVDVKQNDIITYTIKLDNSTGTAPTTVNVKDTVPEGTSFVTGSIKVKDITNSTEESLSDKTAEDLANGIDVDLAAHQTKTIEFQVTVLDNENGKQISNTATVDGTNTGTV